MASRRYRLVWSGPAIEDLREIREYVSQDDPGAARKLATRIKTRVQRLRRFPNSGRAVPEFPESGLREVVVAPYRVVYQVGDEDVVILRVWHSRRDLAGSYEEE